MSPTTYQKTLQMLNPAQTEAVLTIDGPVMVVAGPGTGKTHVLAARIAHILTKTDTPPHAILALTFTESAAVNMRERVVKMIGKDGYYVQIMTFHSFCSDVIKTHPEYFPIDRNSEALNDLEKYDVFQTLIQTLSLEALKPLNMPLFYIKDIIQSISQLKREGLSVTDFRNVIDIAYKDIETDTTLTKAARAKLIKQRDKNIELAHVYAAYQDALRARLRYDFDDMIAFVVQAFKEHELLLQEYQEKLHYFLVDEYQDTNTSQNMVVEMLASYWGEDANLFVVGDPNQSIYRFQGASIENTLNFVQKFPRAKIITLDVGYRGTQVIYDAAHALISHNQLTQEESTKNLHKAVTKKLSSSGEKGTPINYVASTSKTLELVYIAEEIQKLHIEQDIPYEEIAVMYRTNADSVDIQRILEKWGIPYEIEGGENILEAEMIRQLLQVLQVIDDVRKAQEDEKLFEIMAYDWTDIDPILAMKIAQAAGKAKQSIVSLIGAGYEEFMKYYARKDVTHIEFHTAELFVQQLYQWGVQDSRLVFTEWFEKFLQESGHLAYILKQENKIELLTNVNSLFREVKALVSQKKAMKLREFIRALKTMQDNRISIFAEDFNIQKGVVHLSTVHRAKGREWHSIFLAHCIDGKWGNTRSRDMIPFPDGLLTNTDLSKKERNEDERRLFYVALTRAQKQIYVTYPQSIQTGHHSREVAPCMFMEEIPESLIQRVEPSAVADNVLEHVQTLLQPAPSPLVRITDEDFFRDSVRHFKLSITALNTYLRDTDEFIKNVLLKVPRSKPAPMAFGSAMHYALEMANKAQLEGRAYSLEQAQQDFEEAFQREVITDEEYERRIGYGKEVLQKYFAYYQESDSQSKPLFVERFFGSGLRKTVLDDIPLSGRIDRVDLLDAEKKLVRVIDYKTGSARTAGEIEGKTVSVPLSERELSLPESIRGPYKRQLLFYKLLTQLDQTFGYTVEEGVFDFVEPNKQTGKLVRRAFTLKDTDVEDLKTLIRQVMKEIRNLEFLE
jgi:DNA helicase II / ATP-dependent DNA helicase PcrA